MSVRLHPQFLMATALLALVAGCAPDASTSPLVAPDATANASKNPHWMQNGLPTGEHVFGQIAIEPAYDADTGDLMYLLTPIKAPLPSKANSHAISPLYIVEYPGDSQVETPLNCMGVPGNCPDHDENMAEFATSHMPDVYGDDPYAVLGHDHVADGPGAPDFNVAWEVVEVLFTNRDAANTHLTTDQQIEDAVAAGDAVEYDRGFAFNCSVVSPVLYWKGTPVG